MATDRPDIAGSAARPDASDGGQPALVLDVAQALRIHALLREDDVDGAIGAGLAGFVPLPGLDDTTNEALATARDRLLAAWAARERYRARAERLDRIAGQRRRARASATSPAVSAAAAGTEGIDAAPTDADTAATATATTATAATPSRPALPAAAAAALARARARTSGPRT